MIHIHELPRGWLGKTHALARRGAGRNSPWLLFTDADVIFAPGALRRAVAWAEETGADHVTVVPDFLTEGVGERLFQMIFALAFASRVLGGRVGAAGGRAHLGIGAFNLVRLAAFRGIGGFEHLALSVDDDNRLAQAIASRRLSRTGNFGKGGRLGPLAHWLGRADSGPGEEPVRAGRFSDGGRRRCQLAVGSACARPMSDCSSGPGGSGSSARLGIASVAVILSSDPPTDGDRVVLRTRFAGRQSVVYLYAFIRSTLLTLWRGGVRWRGQLYPLSELREHVRMRNAWLRSLRTTAKRRVGWVKPTVIPTCDGGLHPPYSVHATCLVRPARRGRRLFCWPSRCRASRRR